MPLYPSRAWERAMKIKEVITRGMSGQISWMEAAEIIGITDRSMRRWRKRLGSGGYEDLATASLHDAEKCGSWRQQ